VPTTCEATERQRHLLSQLKSVGPAISAFHSREVYYRQFANQRVLSFCLCSPTGRWVGLHGGGPAIPR
jgi:hypothetical protein